MCLSKSTDIVDTLNLYSPNKGVAGKFNSIANPAGYLTHKYSGLDEKADATLNPKIPDPPAPIPPPQAAKAPDTTPLKRRNDQGGFATPGGSTLLTGPSGITRAQLNLGGASLLGG